MQNQHRTVLIIVSILASLIIAAAAFFIALPGSVQADESSTRYSEVVNQSRGDGTRLVISESEQVGADPSTPAGEDAGLGSAELVEVA